MPESTEKDSNVEESIETPLISITKERVDLRKKEQPLVDMKVTNPITYLRRWWKRVIGNEGIDFRFRIKPLTAIAIAFVVAALGFGAGKFNLPFNVPFFSLNTEPTPTPTPDLFRDTAFTGILRYSEGNQKYYLLSQSSEAINLEVPENADLEKVIGNRIFATGKYNEATRTLMVEEINDLEVLPEKIEPVPTTTPTPAPTASPTPEATPTETVLPTPTPEAT